VKFKFILLTMTLLISLHCASQQAVGTVCVASRGDDPIWKEPALANGQINTQGLRLKIDKRPATEWPLRKGLKVELDINKRHQLAVLDSDGKQIESLRFSFSEYKSSNLCMFYDGYQGIQLKEASRRTPWCKCK
jgi:hypothetical protein